MKNSLITSRGRKKMKKYSLIRKYLTIGVVFFFIGTNVVPSATSTQTNYKNIITVDDEPGDADFTSIKEAVNSSSPGDTIEVYSGMYLEQGIRIEKNNITLLGISHELGAGNDSGKPFVKGDGTVTIIKIIASYVTVSNFTIEDSKPTTNYSCIQVGAYWPDPLDTITMTGCIVSDCIISNSRTGILGGHWGHLDDTTIINNQVSNCYDYGIYTEAVYNRYVYTIEGDFYITGNVITDCHGIGLYFLGDWQNISGNRVTRCAVGLFFRGAKNIIYGNDFESCSVGIFDDFIIPRINGKQDNGYTNIITKNNFKNYSRGKIWWDKPPSFLSMLLNKFRKEGWKENYWDTWSGVGPKLIPGVFVFGESLLLPWFNFDWKPTKEPYEFA
jgi:hypothetical protein